MRSVLDRVIQLGLVDSPEGKAYVDVGSTLDCLGLNRQIFVSYTPWGVACIEQAFRDRMQTPAEWDSRERIQEDIKTNPHLAEALKEGLLREHTLTDWAKWYDSFYVRKILKGLFDGLQEVLERDPHLAEASRENLLLNLRAYAKTAHP